ncbi:MAG: hypothetical protein JW889_02420 [Verrucomicrobia bacterium]|nr:hypothetical protein [Verrucomicrobiota bacterium]
MPRTAIAALLICLAPLIAGCGCGKQEDRPASQAQSRGDTQSPADAATQESQDGKEEETPPNPVMYGPHADVIAVLMRTDPWLTVIGSDTPRLVVYADGTLVRLAKLPDEARWSYLESTLPQAEFEALKRQLGPTKQLMALEGFYDLAPNATDCPRTKIYLSNGADAKAVSVRGYSSRAERRKAEEEWPEVRWPELYNALGEFDRVYDALTGLTGTDPHEWEPKYIELYVYGSWPLDEWRKQYESGSGIEPRKPYEDPPSWPEGWSKFDDPLAYRWSERCYSLYVPGSDLGEVREFFRTKGSDRVVLIDDQVYCVSWRYAFPGEGLYRDAFEEAEKTDNPNRLGM